MIGALPGSGIAPATSAMLGYRMVEATLDKQIEAFRKSGQMSRDIDYVRDKIGKIGNAEELVKDYRLYRIVLSAYGLDSQIGSQALMKRVLSEDPADDKSMANRLVDSRYREIARAFDFHASGNAKLQTPAFVDGLIDRYVTAEFEKRTEQTNPGVRLALYFKRMAPNVTSWYQVLGDKPLYEVVRTALQIPAAGSQTGIDGQAKLLERRIGLDSLKDPQALERLIGRFLANYDRTNAPATVSVANLIQPLAPLSGGTTSLGASTILGLASLRR
jgi:Protein of unknown function (DUF1217)